MINNQVETEEFVNPFALFPGTRYMGSKNKIIYEIWNILEDHEFDSFLNLFEGSNVVSYFKKKKNKEVITNDFMSISYFFSKAIVENYLTTLNDN